MDFHNYTFTLCSNITLLFGDYIPLEFADGSYRNSYLELRLYGFPILILMTLFGTLRKNNTGGEQGVKIVLTIVASVASVIIFILALLSNMCGWSGYTELYENKEDPSTKIVYRYFGCGATDSTSPTFNACKIKKITPYFIWVTDIDTTKLDKKIWRPVDKKD